MIGRMQFGQSALRDGQLFQERMDKMDENETTGERVTEWMDPSGFCGRTGYGANVRTNRNWCRCEVERLAAKGLRAGIETNEEGLIAVAIFR